MVTQIKNDAQIQVRIDAKTKREAKMVLEEIGMDSSTAVKILFKQMARTGRFPIELRTINGFTPNQEREMIRETKEAIKHGKSYSTIREAHKNILK